MRLATAGNLDEWVDRPPVRQPRSLRLVRGPQPDHALAQAAAGGAMKALADLYERHNRRVYSVCLSMTRNSAEAEDLTQDVFVHLIRKIGSFRGDSRFSTWLHRLTVNLVLMHFRRKDMRHEEVRDDLEETTSFWQGQRQPISAQLVDRMSLESALAQLPAGCRSVFILFDIAGYRHDEIASLLNCSSGTSKSQLHRARVKLRRLLRPANHS